MRELALAVALASCAPRPPATPEPAPVTTSAIPADASAGEAPTPPGEADADTSPAPSVDAPPGVSPELVRAVDSYLTAANAGDLAAQQAASRADCWAKECGSFAQQAGKKFRAERRESLRRRENHVQVVVDILCEEGRKCDLVYLLFELDPSLRWVVADVTEDGKKADAWVEPPGWVEPKMPPNVPTGAPRPPDAPDKTPAPKGNAVLGGVVGAESVPDAQQVLGRLRAKLKQCYLVGLRADPKAAGKVVLDLQVGASGEVAKATLHEVTGTLPASVGACLVHRVADAKFRAPAGGSAKLRVPIRFAPAP